MTEAAEMKPGDVVQLKSGGPKMTVVSVAKAAGGPLYAECTWFGTQTDKAFIQNFAQAALVRV
jgi:uncharacterized protein YodC (DUF2158 family)